MNDTKPAGTPAKGTSRHVRALAEELERSPVRARFIAFGLVSLLAYVLCISPLVGRIARTASGIDESRSLLKLVCRMDALEKKIDRKLSGVPFRISGYHWMDRFLELARRHELVMGGLDMGTPGETPVDGLVMSKMRVSFTGLYPNQLELIDELARRWRSCRIAGLSATPAGERRTRFDLELLVLQRTGNGTGEPGADGGDGTTPAGTGGTGSGKGDAAR